MKKIFTNLLAVALVIATSFNTIAQDKCAVVGWATQGTGTTGGGSATPKVVSTYADFKSAVENSAVKVIHVSGTITFPAAGRISFQDQDNKSILGLPGSKLLSSDQTKAGSGIMYVKRCNNIIIKNLIFEGPGAYDTDGWDLIAFDECVNVWVDHCEFHDGVDGNLDIKNASDLMSITWCTFSYEKAPKAGGPGGSDDHRYSNLFGSSDGATGDAGKLRITMQYCWWGEGCRERMPRIRYGKVHMVNNYFSSSVANHGIRAAFKADVLAEGNYFISGYNSPIDEYNGDYTAILAKNNTNATNLTKNTAFTPPYTIDVANAADIVTPIKNCAGATLSSVTACSACSASNTNKYPTVSISSPTNIQQFTSVPATVTLSATAADADGTIASVAFYNGTTLLNTVNAFPYTYSWTNVAAGKYTITAKATDNKGAVTTSSAVSITVTNPNNVLPTVNLTSPSNNATYTALATVAIAATATDSDGSISGVSFYNGSTLLGTVNASPYTYSWTNVAAGTYTITAKATDNSGGVSTTSALTVVVNANTTVAPTLAKHGSGSSSQTIVLGQPIVDFNYTWTNATTVTVTGMPGGVTVDINTSTSTVSFTGTPAIAGTYDFTITTVGGSTNVTKSGTISVNTVTAIGDNNLESVSFHPNPVSSTLYLSNEVSWKIVNVIGHQVLSGNSKEISLSNLQEGIYFIMYKNEVHRFIKN